MKNLWKDLKSDKDFNIHFQDDYANDKGPCREYFFNILNTVYPEYIKQIMDHACKQRYSAEGVNKKDEAIRATDEWYE